MAPSAIGALNHLCGLCSRERSVRYCNEDAIELDAMRINKSEHRVIEGRGAEWYTYHNAGAGVWPRPDLAESRTVGGEAGEEGAAPSTDCMTP
jgi:hypothetical protein